MSFLWTWQCFDWYVFFCHTFVTKIMRIIIIVFSWMLQKQVKIDHCTGSDYKTTENRSVCHSYDSTIRRKKMRENYLDHSTRVEYFIKYSFKQTERYKVTVIGCRWNLNTIDVLPSLCTHGAERSLILQINFLAWYVTHDMLPTEHNEKIHNQARRKSQ